MLRLLQTIERSRLSSIFFFFALIFSTATVEMANNSLHKKAENKEVDEFHKIILSCDSNLLIRARNDSPGSYVQWLKDGFKLPNTKFKLGDVKSVSMTDLSKTIDKLLMYILLFNGN